MGSRDFERSMPAEARAKALELLREKGRLALAEVERLCQWEHPWGMPNRLLAERLGITQGRLKRLIQGEHLREKEKAHRKARSAAGTLTLVEHVSRELEFSISLPAGWRVMTDTHQMLRLAAEYRQIIERSTCPRRPTGRYWFPRRPGNGNTPGVIDIRERLLARAQHEARRADAERHARLERMATGLFQAGPAADEDEPMIEITKLQMDAPLTALALYELDKQPPETVPWGNRPSNGITVDGLSGIVYYFAMDTGERPLTYAIYKAHPVFFNVYLTDGLDAWILSCQCRCGEAYMKAFQAHKPLFRRIVRSFRRRRNTP